MRLGTERGGSADTGWEAHVPRTVLTYLLGLSCSSPTPNSSPALVALSMTQCTRLFECPQRVGTKNATLGVKPAEAARQAKSHYERSILIISKSIFPLFFAIGVFGCAESDHCDEFPVSLLSASAVAPGVTETDKTSASVARAIAEIDLCYSSTEYSETDYKKIIPSCMAWSGWQLLYYFRFRGGGR